MKTYIKATTVPTKGKEVIDDNATDNAHTWSSEKISESFNSIHISDITSGEYTCTSIGQQFKIPLSSFGKNIDRDKVIGFTVLHWGGIKFIADGDWYESGTGDTGFGCALTSLHTGTGWARVRCTYFE